MSTFLSTKKKKKKREQQENRQRKAFQRPRSCMKDTSLAWEVWGGVKKEVEGRGGGGGLHGALPQCPNSG